MSRADLPEETVSAKFRSIESRLAILERGTSTRYGIYTPVLTAATTNPSIGGGSVQGDFIVTGRMVRCWVRISFGSGTTAGSGVYYVSTPVAMDTTFANRRVGVGTAFNFSPSEYSAVMVHQDGVNNRLNFSFPSPSGVLQYVDNNDPFTWVNGSELNFFATYLSA
jgi:hypothetical protein